ncbi:MULTISPECIES: DUF7482 domain-containing protein [Marinovum]|uniref:DUF7482 domain-containing protein n=1 Tax=Marinovum TaxID=367771 RepID=UPI00237B74C0|nr:MULTISPECIES: hypothetical protein [Marinovum]MDD9744064.1 hypothetical protein [Marinovum sp. PR37]
MRRQIRKIHKYAAVFLALGLTAAPASAQTGSMSDGSEMTPMMDMSGGMDMADIPRVPPVFGYATGEDIHFIHTEVSDPGIAGILSDMMGSPVPVVPSLADIPADLLAPVYVFENGLQPDGPRGPLGFQPDVFDRPAGTEAYTPLRKIMLVNWSDSTEPRVLRSAEAIAKAEANNEIRISDSGIVVNMPFLTWPDGSR